MPSAMAVNEDFLLVFSSRAHIYAVVVNRAHRVVIFGVFSLHYAVSRSLCYAVSYSI